MSSETSKVKTESRTRAADGTRRQAARNATLRRLSLDMLETRTLMAVLPAPIFNTTPPNTVFNSFNGTYQTNGASLVGGTEGNYSSPSIAVDPSNPQKLVSAWTRNDPKLAPGRTELVEFAVSNDGGKHWTSEGQPQNFGNTFSGFAADPTTSNPQVPFAVATDASVAFDRNENFYLLWSEHQTGNGAGEIRLMKFDFSSSTPLPVFSNPTNVYEWTADQAIAPVLSVDASTPTFSDTNADGTTVTQNDKYAGNVYVSWETVDVAPAFNPGNYNPNRIALAASSDGGQSFSAAQYLNQGGNFGGQRNVTPQIVVSQGSAPRAALTNGPNDPGSPGVTPGKVSAVWDDYGSLSQASPPLDQIVTGGISNGTFTQTFPGPGATDGGFISDAIAIQNNPVNIPSVTSFPINVNITDPRFLSLSNLTASIALTDPNIGALSIVLQPPTNSGLQPITLLNNQIDAAGNVSTFRGAAGANLGVLNGQPVGTTFDDNATRDIVDPNNSGGRGAAAPFIGHFRPENGASLVALYRGATAGAANSANSVNGTWNLVVTVFRNGNGGNLQNVSLSFVSGMTPDTTTVIAETPVRARESGASTVAAADAQGIAPVPVIASDNTLGAYSPNEGRLYVSYVGRPTFQNEPADNTDIHLVVSDDGGTTWNDPTVPSSQFGFSGQGTVDFGSIVNDDNSQVDGYSEGQNSPLNNSFGSFNGGLNGGLAGRPQFQPSVAVDQATGTLVMSWLDARNDASRARVATYLTASIDGGQTFSPQVYGNDSQVATDAITGNVVNLGPIPSNESAPSAAGVETAVGYGSHQGLAVFGGQAHPVWSDDLNGGPDNKQTLFIYTNTAYYAAGPRVVSATSGPIGQAGDAVNSDRSPTDNTPVASAFVVTFDRPIDPASFTASDAVVMYRDTTAGTASSPNGLTSGPVPVSSVVALDSGPFGATKFQVNFAPRTGVGTYSLEITSADIHDRIRSVSNNTSPIGSPQTLTASVASPGSVPATVPSGSTTVVSIPATVLPANQVISNVSVQVFLNTTQDFFIGLTLIAPDGTLIPLINRNSGVFGSGGFQGTTFSSTDPNAIPLSQGVPNYQSPPTYLPASTLAKLNGGIIPAGSSWKLQVQNTRFGGPVATLNDFSITFQPAAASQTTNPGNPLDQNNKAYLNTLSSFSNLGDSTDFFASPMPINPAPNPVLDQYGSNVTPVPLPSPTPFNGPFDPNTLPLILPGPHVASSTVAGQPAAPGNLVLNSTVSSIDVTFDRDMDASTLVNAPGVASNPKVLRVMGPVGPINGPFTITQPNPFDLRTYRISFPTQTLSGNYTVTLASSISDTHGNQLDTNLNAGLDLLRGTTGGTTTTVVYNAPATFKASTFSAPVPNVPLPLTDGRTTVSNLNVPDAFLASQVSVQLNITHPNDPDLQISLVAPNGVSILLVPRKTGTTGTHANFSNTIFADQSLAPGSTPTNPIYVLNSPISNGGPPFFGSFAPSQPLSALNNVQVNGTWKLVIDDASANGSGAKGTLNSWSLTFQKSLPITDLGEPVADQANVSFRIFTMDPTNRQSSNTWTGVGPAPVTSPGSPSGTSNGFAGQVSAVAVDPSDPSGNTVFASGASGGVWKTSNFLTTDPQGPSWIPLTDFGPTSGMNIGSIAVFGQNSDLRQSIIIAGTGNAATSNHAIGGNTFSGVGFIISKDGGATWRLLDSTNNNLPFAQRDHLFAQANGFALGTTTAKVVVDPHPTPTGQVIIYAAMTGPNGGLWQSTDTGQTWQKLSNAAQGNASDVSLDYNSATVNAVSNPTGNVNTIYAAFPGSGVYISANRGATLVQMTGGTVDPLIYDSTTGAAHAVPVTGGNVAPVSGAGGRIVLAKPAPVAATGPGADIQNTLYERWLYAAVAMPDGTFDGVYLTKDNGQTWTKLKIAGLPDTNNVFPVPAVPSNDNLKPQYSVASDNLFQHADYDLALAVDPTNPNVFYLGGTANGNQSGFIRVDATTVYDSHALLPASGSRNDGGQSQFNSTGAVVEVNRNNGYSTYEGAFPTVNTFTPGPYLNLTLDPSNPFSSNSTIDVFNVASFVNDGTGLKWTALDPMLFANANTLVPSSNIHNIVTYIDPLTGNPRLLVADDEGVFSGVINPTGTLITSVGDAALPGYSRNGNLQIAQLTYGAAQPSTTLNAAATIQNGNSSTPTGLFYGNGQNVGQVQSDPAILSNGNIAYQGSLNGADQGFFSISSADQAGVGIGVDQQGNNVVYRYLDTAYGGNKTNFFQISTDGGKTWISRTTGLEQTANDPQWPGQSPNYGGGTDPLTGNVTAGIGAITFGNFAVNPLNSDQVIISSNAGRIFSTSDQGKSGFLSIGEPGQLDSSYAPALAFGAPSSSDPFASLNSFLYAGTVSGNIFVSTTGGGGNAGSWTKVSTGLDGSPVVKIIADPTRGTHDAYAVTQKGVYYTADSVTSATNPTPIWTSITGNLFSLSTNAFGQIGSATQKLTYLTSIQADWRYVIPNAVTTGTGTGTGTTVSGPSTHPILYVGGDSGVYRSLDNGATWTPFPSQAVDGSPVDGGDLPNVHVTDLATSLGKIDPTTGHPVTTIDPATNQAIIPSDNPDLLLASTFGRGQFAIRLAPLVLPGTVALDKASINSTTNGVPLVRISQPVINGVSEQSAFGNTVRITILDLTNPANPVVIGGFDPSKNTASGNPTDIAANQTDSSGKFQVTVNPDGFTTNGLKTIGIQASDASGALGNIATLKFNLLAALTSHNAPATPTLNLAAGSDTSGTFRITRVTQPTLSGFTDPHASVQVTLVKNNGQPVSTPLPAVTSDQNGFYSVQFPTALSDGIYLVQAVATNTFNNLSSPATFLSFTVKTTGPTVAPTLQLSPASDTGIVGDSVTSVKRPVFTGVTDPFAKVYLYQTVNPSNPFDPRVGLNPSTGLPNYALATVNADGNGNYTIQPPNNLGTGTLNLGVVATDAAGNLAVSPSKPLVLRIVTVAADFTGTGKTNAALFRRNAGAASWIIQGQTGPAGVSYGASTLDIPLVGDFDGDGVADKAVYRPSVGTFFVSRSSAGDETVNLSAYNTAGTLPTVGDFDGDGRTDPGLYNPANGQWTLSESTAGLQQVTFHNPAVFQPRPGDLPVPGNYDNTGKDELAVYRPSTSQFFIKTGTESNGVDDIRVLTVGAPGGVPVPGNYNDTPTYHATEAAVYDPASSTWIIRTPQGNQSTQFGNPGDIPAPGDYDGLGVTEIAVYRPAIASFIVDGPSKFVRLGAAGDIPVTSPLVYRNIITNAPTLTFTSASIAGGNVTSVRHPIFTGTTDPGVSVDLIRGGVVVNGGVADGSGNFAIGDPTNLTDGTYTYQVRAHSPSSPVGPVSPALSVKVVTVQGDYAGAGVTQPALFVRSPGNAVTWFVQNFKPLNGRTFSTGKGDVPVVGDFLASGQEQIAIFTPSTGNWAIESSAGNYAPQTIATNLGAGSAYIPVPADYYGVGKDVAAVYETTTGRWIVQGMAPVARITLNQLGDVPVPGNYDNSTGKVEEALYRPGNATWFVKNAVGTYQFQFGNAGDVPVPGSYNSSAGSQLTYPAVWRPTTGQYLIRLPNNQTQTDTFAKGDIPAPGDYDHIGSTEAAVYRPSTGQFLVMGPKDVTPRVLTSGFGGQGFIPVTAPYVYRQVPGSTTLRTATAKVVKAPAPNLGATAQAFQAPTPAKSLTPAPAKPPVSVSVNRVRPLQVAPVKVATAPVTGMLKSQAVPRKGV